ncbi:glyoxalase superfamily protein [Aureimonas sp. N4]|uniref:glyoxalase superfamily protein n=1 Tax=Aureimonas sp. N4 TaxID=1638165 RepID=UPI0007809CB8|nr:glyoxalase superfamily protein [Aureimonas sp. N4]
MTRSPRPLPALDGLKDQAKRLRAALSEDGQTLSYSKSLELVAAQHGFRDWNTLHAQIGHRGAFDPYRLGARVKGFYLGQPFEASVLGVEALGSESGRYRLVLQFDEPVDVVTFDSFSAFRRRVSCRVDGTGRTMEKTSNGRPQVELLW